MPLTPIGDLIKHTGKATFPLEAMQAINLADYSITTNQRCITVTKPNEAFFIRKPTTISGALVEFELSPLEDLLRQQERRYSVTHFPPGYYENQTMWLYELELEADHRCGAEITLIDFGYTYGKICLNGVEVDISHAGGTSTNPAYDWADSTHGFYLAGPHRFQAFRAFIEGTTKYIPLVEKELERTQV